MWELRWVLLGLGVLGVAGIYFWPRFSFRRKLAKPREVRPEPPAEELDVIEAPQPAPEPAERLSTPATSAPRKVISLRFMAKDGGELGTEQAVLELRKAGLKHGKYGIFHYSLEEDGAQEPEFSVASLLEPGSFDISNLKDATLPGMSFFLVLPGTGDPVSRFDRMVEVARSLTQSLDAELFDERGSSWSIQRERYVREEIIEYRHQHIRS